MTYGKDIWGLGEREYVRGCFITDYRSERIKTLRFCNDLVFIFVSLSTPKKKGGKKWFIISKHMRPSRKVFLKINIYLCINT